MLPWARERLAAAGVPSPDVDAELLAAYVLGVPRSRLVLAAGFTPAQAQRYRVLVERRAARVPLQHLTGTAGFGHLELAVGPGVFIPRPETELLAQWAVGRPGQVFVDLGSGSGALALAIAGQRPGARVLAVERAQAALTWLRCNVAGTAVEVVAGDATDPVVLAELDGTVDVVVSNPPYVPAGEPVAPEVAGYDPAQAVFGGPDGLAVIRPLVARAAALLRPGGWLGMEHHESHAPVLPELLGHWFTELTGHRDLTGRPRFVTARRMARPEMAD